HFEQRPRPHGRVGRCCVVRQGGLLAAVGLRMATPAPPAPRERPPMTPAPPAPPGRSPRVAAVVSGPPAPASPPAARAPAPAAAPSGAGSAPSSANRGAPAAAGWSRHRRRPPAGRGVAVPQGVQTDLLGETGGGHGAAADPLQRLQRALAAG